MVRFLRRRRYFWPLLAEAVVVVVLYGLYSAARTYVEGVPDVATANTLRLVELERNVGLYHELTVQRAVEAVPGLMPALAWLYFWSYLPIIVGGAMLIYARDRALYARYRTAFFVAAALGLVLFAVLPMAPPRLVPELGFADPVKHGAEGAHTNDFAAFPSFHFGFIFLSGLGVAHAHRFRPLSLLALLPSVLMLLVIVATANHFFLDAAGGGVVVIAGLGVATSLQRVGPMVMEGTRRVPQGLAMLLEIYRL